MYVYTYIHIYMYTYRSNIHIYIYICIYMYIYIYMYICIYTYIHVFWRVHVFVYMVLYVPVGVDGWAVCVYVCERTWESSVSFSGSVSAARDRVWRVCLPFLNGLFASSACSRRFFATSAALTCLEYDHTHIHLFMCI